MEEWVIDTDLSTDLGDSIATKTVIPKGELADEASVPRIFFRKLIRLLN